MAETPPSSNNSKRSPEKQPLIPPEERFWQRYSPHFEFPVSICSSAFLHTLGLGILAFVPFLWALMGLDRDAAPLPTDTIVIAGGGGHPEGIGNDIDAGNSGPPAGGLYHRRQNTDGRCFARAVWPQQAEGFAAPHAERDAAGCAVMAFCRRCAGCLPARGVRQPADYPSARARRAIRRASRRGSGARA